jgi:WD40 repeat protein/serine/threonine protein kinase/Flp pilus assembly protein TadD
VAKQTALVSFMAYEHNVNETLIRQLPLPLAQLYRRAHNAKSPMEQHLTAFSLWEASLKLLSGVAVVEYAELGRADPELSGVLQNLARPSLGHWWKFARRLVPVLADQGDGGFQKVRALLLGKTRDDMPRAAGLDAALLEALQQGKGVARATVRLTELFDRLLRYRNIVILGHAAPGQLRETFHDRMAKALLAGTAELLGRLDVLAGRRLVNVGEVRQKGGVWHVQRFGLTGEQPQRLPNLELQFSESSRVPYGERIYLEDEAGVLHLLHPLLLYDAETEEVKFLNARRGKDRMEYLCYTSGVNKEWPDLGGEQRTLLANALHMEVTASDVAAWSARAKASEPNSAVDEGPSPTRRTLGEFELLSELGIGGMGVVYRAWQPSLGRQVALKKLLRSGDPKTEARFRREIKALGHVDHPHLVKVFTSGSDGDDWFFAMELVEGVNLSAVCEHLQASGTIASAVDSGKWQSTVSTVCQEARREEKPLSTSFIPPSADDLAAQPLPQSGHSHVGHMVELVWQVSQAAHALHLKGVIHRDIKPGNIMVTADGSTAVLMDLGLAQIADEEEGGVTRTREFVGTLRYASPQQVLAEARLEPSTDIYSLGATLWELLTLRPIYGATKETPRVQLMEMILRKEPERPRKYNSDVHSDLEAIVFKCMEKDPGKRYATAAALGEDLRRFLDGAPVAARPVGSLEKAIKWVRRYPAHAIATSLAVTTVILVSGAVTIAWLWRVAENARGQAEQERAQAEDAQHKEKMARQNEEQAKKKLEEQLKINNDINVALEAAKLKLAKILYLDRVAFAWTLWQVGDRLHSAELLANCDEQYRNWEWHHLNIKTRHLLTLAGHKGQVRHISYSPDGKRLASASEDHTVKIWDAATGEVLANLVGHKDLVEQVNFSPDGRWLTTASHDKTVKLWDASSGKEVATLAEPNDLVERVSFSPDGKWLATANQNNAVTIWDASNGKQLAKLARHLKRVTFLRFSLDGKQLATASEDKTVKVWEVPTGKELATLIGHQDKIVHVFFSPTRQQLATASEDNTVKLWDTTTGKEVNSFVGHKDWVVYVCVSPDGKRLASASLDGTAKLWDAASGMELEPLWNSARVAQICFSPDSQLLATATQDQSITLWQASTGKELAKLNGHTHRIVQLIFSPDGQRLASASEDKTVRLWDTASGKEVDTLAHEGGVMQVRFSPDGQRLASASRDRTVKLWNATYRKEAARLEGRSYQNALSPDGQQLALANGRTVTLWDATSGQYLRALTDRQLSVNDICFSPDGLRLATADNGNTAMIWDATSGEKIATLPDHKGKVVLVRYSPDGKRIATATEDNTVRLWDASSTKQIASLPGEKEKFILVSFSRDGKRIVSAGKDATLMFWDASTGKELATLVGHKSAILHVSFSPDGHRLASASHDKTVMLWDAVSGKELATLAGHSNAVLHVAFSPDGQRLASASEDKSVRLWDTSSGREVAALAHSDVVRHVSFSHDSKRLASASLDGTVKVWDAQGGKELVTLKGHKAGVLGVEFSADDQRLASGGSDGEVMLWFGKQDTAAWERRQAVQLEEQAIDAMLNRHWFAAAFHFELVVQRQPNNASRLADLAHALAKSRQWDKACAAFAKAAALWPSDFQLRHDLALAELARDNRRAFRDICREMLQDFGQTKSAGELNRIAWLGVLLPDFVDDAQPWLRLAEKAAREQPRWGDCIACLGAAYYRAGQLDDALKQLNLAVKLDAQGSHVITQLFLTMTHHKLGHDNEARQWLDKAHQRIDQLDNIDWTSWDAKICYQLLRREAERMIVHEKP